MDGGAVPHAVRMEPLRAQTGLGDFGAIAVLGEDIADSKACEMSTTVIAKERVAGSCLHLLFRKERFENRGRLGPERTDALLTSLSEEPNVIGFFQLEIARL
jgi:hypothetical protein